MDEKNDFAVQAKAEKGVVQTAQRLRFLLEKFLSAIRPGCDPMQLTLAQSAYQSAAVQAYSAAEEVGCEPTQLEELTQQLQLADFVLRCYEEVGTSDAPSALRTRVVSTAPAALRPYIRAAGLVPGPAHHADVERQFTVVIGGKVYAPRMGSFHEVLTEHYVNRSSQYLKRRQEFAASLTELALRFSQHKAN